MKENHHNLGNLPEGSRFEIIGLEKCFKNLILANTNESGSLIRGEILNKDKKWVPIPTNYAISNETNVRLI